MLLNVTYWAYKANVFGKLQQPPICMLSCDCFCHSQHCGFNYHCFSPNLVNFWKKQGKGKNKGKKTNISTSVSFTLYLCLKKDWTRPTFSSNTSSAHMHAHTHTHWQSCLLFWALCLLSLLLVSRLCVWQWCCFLPTSGTAASHESAPFSSVFIDRASLCVSQLVPLSLYFPSFWTHIVCVNPFFPHSETGISQCNVIPTR